MSVICDFTVGVVKFFGNLWAKIRGKKAGENTSPIPCAKEVGEDRMTQVEYCILNLDTKEVISLDGMVVIKWRGKEIKMTGYTLFEAAEKLTTSTTSRISFPQQPF